MYSKTKKTIFLSFAFIIFFLSANAQALLQFSQTEKPSFKQMQRDLAAWKDTTNLQESKNWKYIKRWEADMQMHTDAQGEPTGFYDYTKVLIESAAQKESAQRSGVSNYWLPAGPYQLPTNQTGYMQNGMGRVNCIALIPSTPAYFMLAWLKGAYGKHQITVKLIPH
ncbi:MAG: hypothetical protein IPJ26_09185 [Bacteroidetes bacterium]|nr:hypothetical protein [Bacteroidota bacterium]